MFAFGSAITKPDVFLRCARPGIDRVAEPDSVVLEHSSTGTLFEAYNALLDRAAQLPGLEALVLVHQDAELVSPDFCATVRRTLADPDVALVGCLAAVDVLSIAWWEGSVTWASHAQPYGDDGRMTYGFSWDPAEAPPYARLGEVEAELRRRLDAIARDAEAERALLETRLHDVARRVDDGVRQEESGVR